MSIVRVGLAETKNFANGYEAIFGKSTSESKKTKAPAKKKKSRNPKSEIRKKAESRKRK